MFLKKASIKSNLQGKKKLKLRFLLRKRIVTKFNIFPWTLNKMKALSDKTRTTLKANQKLLLNKRSLYNKKKKKNKRKLKFSQKLKLWTKITEKKIKKNSSKLLSHSLIKGNIKKKLLKEKKRKIFKFAFKLYNYKYKFRKKLRKLFFSLLSTI